MLLLIVIVINNDGFEKIKENITFCFYHSYKPTILKFNIVGNNCLCYHIKSDNDI